MSRRPFIVALAVIAVTAVSCSRDPQKLKMKYFATGEQALAKKDYATAIIEYRKALAADSLFGEARLQLATAHQAAGDVHNALGEYIRAADLMPTNVNAQLRAGHVLLASGQ